jgi:hypothetical protein
LPREIEFQKSEIILPAAIQQIKEYNRRLAERHGKKYCVNDQLLKRVLLVDISDGTDIVDTKIRLARRAANILVYMMKRKPFCSMNPDTGLAILAGYLKANNLPLPLGAVVELADKVLPENRNNPQLRQIIERFLVQNLQS